MVPVWSVLQWFQRMLREKWAYDWSGAEYGKVSCSGAWVFVFRQWGASLYHGSNTIWRKHTGRKGKLDEVKPLPGWAVFKWRKDGEPEQYETDGQDDYYHMGCFVGPTADHPEGAVIEAKGTNWGVVETSIRDSWSHAAEMSGVDYAVTMQPQVVMGQVVAESGSTVNMRKTPSADAIVLLRVSLGAEVEILDVSDGWAKIRVDRQTGYMLERFIDMDIQSGVTAPSGEGNTEAKPPALLSQEVEHIMAILERQQAALREADHQISTAIDLLAGHAR